MKKTNTSLTADIAIIKIIEHVPYLLLIQRKNNPFSGYWAFPGGFTEETETSETSALRELTEETGITVNQLELLALLSSPERDSRGRIVSALYLYITNENLQAQSGDDAKDAKWFRFDQIPELAFEHNQALDIVKSKLRELSFYGKK